MSADTAVHGIGAPEPTTDDSAEAPHLTRDECPLVDGRGRDPMTIATPSPAPAHDLGVLKGSAPFRVFSHCLSPMGVIDS